MKIFNELSNQDEDQKQLFALDSPIFQRAKGALKLTIYLSAISVTAGMYFQFQESINSAWWLWRWLGYIALMLFVFGWALYIDGTSTAAVEWVVNSLQNKTMWKTKKEKIRTPVLIVCWCVGVFFLTALSLRLSEASAEKAGKVWSGSASLVDTDEMVTSTEADKLEALAVFDARYKETSAQYDDQITALEAPYLQKIKQYEGYITTAKLERAGAELQKYINRQNGNIARKQSQMNSATAKLRAEKVDVLREIRIEQDEERKRINKINDTNLNNTLASNEDLADEHTKFRDTFSSILSFIAGYAILIALLLAATIGLMKGRAGWTPKPIFTTTDFSESTGAEILKTPLVVAERLLLNLSRWIKDSLPDLREPQKEFSYEDYENNIIPMYDSEKARHNLNAKPKKKKRQHIAASADEDQQPFFFRQSTNHEQQLTHEIHEPQPTKSVGPPMDQPTNFSWTIKDSRTGESKQVGLEDLKVVNPNLNLWQLKQKLKKYKKAVGEHTQKGLKQKKQDGQMTNRTASAIENNQLWVLSIERRISEIEPIKE